MTDMLLRRDSDGVAILTLNRPPARNALSMGLMEALDAALAAIADDPAIARRHHRRQRPRLLRRPRPAGDARHPDRVTPMRRCSRSARVLMQRIVRLPKPVIARVHGAATAAGCQLVATCDLAVAADTARFATPGVNIGLFCSTPMVALTRAVGRKAAMEMLLTGDLIAADRAREIGLVNRVVPEDATSTRRSRPRPPDRREKSADPRDRQGGLLSPGRDGPRRRLRLRRRRS